MRACGIIKENKKKTVKRKRTGIRADEKMKK